MYVHMYVQRRTPPSLLETGKTPGMDCDFPPAHGSNDRASVG